MVSTGIFLLTIAIMLFLFAYLPYKLYKAIRNRLESMGADKSNIETYIDTEDIEGIEGYYI